MSLPYEKDLIHLAHEMRMDMTKHEQKLWFYFLRGYPVRFQRQKTIGRFIVDFYCHRARLAVELDGSQHFEPEQAEADMQRTLYLESQGVRVLRFSNRDVDRQFSSVCESIDAAVQGRISHD